MSGTLLSDLDSAGGASMNDDTAVQRILNEMNGTPAPLQQVQMPQQQIQPPSVQSRQPPAQVINSPNPNSTMQHSMDSMPSTAHIIGGEHPTNADFAAMMYSSGRGAQGMQQQQQYIPQNPYANPIQTPQMYAPPIQRKSYYSEIASELKTPILVALLFFVLSLPFVSVLMSHYLPSLVKATGELTTVGLLIKSLLAGILFWVLHRIVAPLLIN